MLDARPQQTLDALRQFLTTPLDVALSPRRAAEAADRALALFHAVADDVPAYRDFLREQGVDPAGVRTLEDFRRVPCVTKENYLQRHPLAELCRGGRLESCDMIAVSSGSTGQPTFWPRYLTDELQITARFEQIFHDSFEADRRTTLAVVCFALGTWVGGMYTAACCRHLAAKGYPITVVTPGSNRDEIFRAVRELGPAFEQVVLLGYPPFLKGVIDEGRARGVEWPRYRIKLVTAGEVFSEEWRALVGERIGSERPCFDSAALYGTADAGVLANETPLSICIRRWLAATPDAARELFGEARLPTLAQYDPVSRFFEVEDGGLLFTGDNGIPLVRYNILDTGGIVGFQDLLAFARERGFDPVGEIERRGARSARPLPFVFVFGRSNFAISYYGANVYPENVSVGLEQPEVAGWVTGKFVMQSVEDAERDRHLALDVELAPGVEADDAKRAAIAEAVLAQLRRLNSEFANYVPAERQTPRVTLAPNGDPDRFPPGVKHRYTRHG